MAETIEDTGSRLSTAADATGGKYSVQFHTYPEDLFGGTNKYGNSWVMININVLSNSKYKDQYKFVSLSKEENRNFSNTERRNQEGINTGANVIKSSTAVGGATGAVSGAQSALNNGGTLKQKLITVGTNATVGALQGGAAAAVAVSPLASNKRELKRIDTAIQLPMPSNLITGYTMDWGESDTAIFDLLARAPTMGVDVVKAAFSGDLKSFVEKGGEIGEAATSFALGAQSFFGSGAVSAAAGLAANPKKEMIFNGVNFRSFTLDYKFYPKSRSEMMNVFEIINTLKFHMHPEYKAEGRYTFVYPSEFDITFYHRGEENVFVNKIATSVLKSVRVNYTPDGLWATHYDGAPNAIQVSLDFQELSILTKEQIRKGY